MKIKLDERCARTDLTDREIAKIVCGNLYSLVGMSDVETVKPAINWIAQTDEIWRHMQQIKEALEISPPDYHA